MAKVLLCGEVRGQVPALLRLLQALQAKGPFDFAFCVGNFFSPPQESSQLTSAAAASSSLGGGPPGAPDNEGPPQEDLLTAVRAALEREAPEVYGQLQRCCGELPFPIYVIDEAASVCVQRLQRQREAWGSAKASSVSSEAAGESRVKEETDHNNGCMQNGGAVALEGGNAEASEGGSPPEAEASSEILQKKKERSASPCSDSKCTYTPLQLMDNVWLLSGAGVANLQGLNVAFYALPAPPQERCKAEEAPQQQQEQQEQQEDQRQQQSAAEGDDTFAGRLAAGWGGFSAFRGRTDLLLTTQPPVGLFAGLPPEARPTLPQQQQQQQEEKKEQRRVKVEAEAADSSPSAADGAAGEPDEDAGFQGCAESSCLLDFLEPRHFICSGLGLFWQRPHYRGRHFGFTVRLISLGVVGMKGPQAKAFHALQLRPIAAMLQLLQEVSAATQQQQQQQQQQQLAEMEEAAQETRAALFFLPPDSSSPNPFTPELRDRRLQLPASPGRDEEGPLGLSPGSGRPLQRPLPRGPKRQRQTGVVLVDNLPYEVTDGEALEAAMAQFGKIKFVFVPKDKADPMRGTGKAYVVYVEPEDAAKAAAASGQLEGGGRPLGLRLYFDKIPFDRPTGAKRVKGGEVINTEPHADCWFCLANPQVEKHMIVDIGDLVYSAIPKGGLVPQHLLLIPIAHLPSLAYADEATCREASLTIARLRGAFRKAGLDLVVYERYVPMKATRAMHSQLHVIPCKRSDSLRASEFFEKRARRAGLSLQKLSASSDVQSLRELANDPRLGYFYVEIPGVCTAQGQSIDRFLHVQSAGDGGKIPMNFGREVMAELLGEKAKVSWQACVVPRDEEERLAAELRQMVCDF
ncbi:hypothetical protein Emed_000302 [Eimeria media]